MSACSTPRTAQPTSGSSSAPSTDTLGAPVASTACRKSPRHSRTKASPSPAELRSTAHGQLPLRISTTSSMTRGPPGRALAPSKQQLASPLDYRSTLDSAAPYAATSPCRSPRHKTSGWERAQRRREMSVPLLSQTLSHFSLSHSTPPLGSDLSPDAMTRPASSSTPPSMITPPTAVLSTPRRLPHIHRMNTPAPLARELTYPNTAPMPVIHSLLGSPFSTKRQAYPFGPTSPTWTARGAHGNDTGIGLVVEWEEDEWREGKDDLSDLHSSSGLLSSNRRLSGCSSTENSSGSCTSASSANSSGHLQKTPLRPSIVSIWGDEATFFDEVNPATPNRQLFPPRKADDVLFTAIPGLPLQISPLTRKVRAGMPARDDDEDVGPGPSSPVQALMMTRGLSTASATETSLSQQTNTPLAGFLPPRLSKSAQKLDTHKAPRPPRSACMPTFDGLLDPGDYQLTQRRTSDPNGRTPDDDAFAKFLARCNGGRLTQSEIHHSQRSDSPPPSSDPNDYDVEQSPSRPMSVRAHIPPLPPRRVDGPVSPSGPKLTTRHRLERRGSGNTTSLKSTPKTHAARAVRPTLKRGSTEPQMHFGTPVSQLFGDDKPSPAAFASTGLVKKRGLRLNMPRFSDMAKGRSWSPINTGAASASTTAPSTETRSKATGAEEFMMNDDSDQDQLSPIRPLRSQPFRRTASGHSRVSSVASVGHARNASTASDIATSPFRRTHARVSSTASSISCSRGLRRKGSTMFTSGSIEDALSPATPTKPLVFLPTNPKFGGLTTPSPTVSTTTYPFTRRRASSASTTEGTSPTAPVRVRQLSRAPLARTSNPMLAATYRTHAHGAPPPNTPTADTVTAETYMSEAARVAGAGRFERDFTLVTALGSGEFSSVWKVRSKADNSIWAVKTGRPYTGQRNRLNQLEEVAILRQLSLEPHEHIVKFVDSWEQSGRLYIRTELGECGDLARYLLSLGDQGGLGEGCVWKMAVELVSALEHIHGNGILHLDFKPANVLITREGSLKVADYGMSVFHRKAIREGSVTPPFEDDDMVTAHVPVLDREHEGDREYLCPEALHDSTPGPGADVYSLGIFILEVALNVVLPSNGDAWVKLRNDDFSDIVEHYVERGAPAPFLLDAFAAPGDPPAPVVSRGLVDMFKRMMAADPAKRMRLDELSSVPPLARARAAKARGEEAGLAGRRAGPALVDEDPGWLGYVLGEE